MLSDGTISVYSPCWSLIKCNYFVSRTSILVQKTIKNTSVTCSITLGFFIVMNLDTCTLSCCSKYCPVYQIGSWYWGHNVQLFMKNIVLRCFRKLFSLSHKIYIAFVERKGATVKRGKLESLNKTNTLLVLAVYETMRKILIFSFILKTQEWVDEPKLFSALSGCFFKLF